MTVNIKNQSPFLRVQRLYPQDPQALSVEVDRSYTDISNAVNARTIGIFTSIYSIQNGETWYQNGLRYQGFRQFYPFTSAGSIPHNINTSTVFAFTRIYGTFTDGTNWYPVPLVSTVNINQQASIQITPSNIVLTFGAGAPVPVSGYIVLEWLIQS